MLYFRIGNKETSTMRAAIELARTVRLEFWAELGPAKMRYNRKAGIVALLYGDITIGVMNSSVWRIYRQHPLVAETRLMNRYVPAYYCRTISDLRAELQVEIDKRAASGQSRFVPASMWAGLDATIRRQHA